MAGHSDAGKLRGRQVGAGALFHVETGLSLAQSQELAGFPKTPGSRVEYRKKTRCFTPAMSWHRGRFTYRIRSAEVRLTTQSQTDTDQSRNCRTGPRSDGSSGLVGRSSGKYPHRRTRCQPGYNTDRRPGHPPALPGGRKAAAKGDFGGLDLTKSFESAAAGTWATLTVPLVCLKARVGPWQAAFSLQSRSISSEFR